MEQFGCMALCICVFTQKIHIYAVLTNVTHKAKSIKAWLVEFSVEEAHQTPLEDIVYSR